MKANPENRFVKSLDLVIDFATLGEYRVVTDAPARTVAAEDIWAEDIEWTTGPRRRETACSLPRARDRKLARAVVGV
jgi:hypothetical protein